MFNAGVCSSVSACNQIILKEIRCSTATKIPCGFFSPFPVLLLSHCASCAWKPTERTWGWASSFKLGTRSRAVTLWVMLCWRWAAYVMYSNVTVSSAGWARNCHGGVERKIGKGLGLPTWGFCLRSRWKDGEIWTKSVWCMTFFFPQNHVQNTEYSILKNVSVLHTTKVSGVQNNKQDFRVAQMKENQVWNN